MIDLAAAASSLENASQCRLEDPPPFLGGFQRHVIAIDLWLATSEASSWDRLNKPNPSTRTGIFTSSKPNFMTARMREASRTSAKVFFSARFELCMGLAKQANGQIDSIGAVAWSKTRRQEWTFRDQPHSRPVEEACFP